MKRAVNTIVIHCSASPNGQDFKAKDVDAWHKARGFNRASQAARAYNPTLKHIGYHYVIEIDGNIALGRALEEIGAHVQGNNSKSIGICLIGTDVYSAAQMHSLKNLLITITNKIYGHPATTITNAIAILKNMGITIKGHRDFSPDLNGDGQITRTEWIKTCPGFDVRLWLKDLS